MMGQRGKSACVLLEAGEMLTQIQWDLSLNFNSFAQLISFRVHILLNHKDHIIGRERTDDLCFY